MAKGNGRMGKMGGKMGKNRLTGCKGRLLNGSSLAGRAALIVAGMASAAHAGTLPTGGSIAAGGATISNGANTTTITQTTSRAVIDWGSFSVGAGNAVTFQQPNAQSATLNRVTGTTTSTIAGEISSNGAVYLINPNGIVITSTGTVNSGGGFVASTLDMTDADFMAGNNAFAGKGASRSVSNAGRITAGQGAFVALLGGAVSNSGTITVPLGKLAMGSGEQIALDLNGGNFLQVAVPTALITGSTALVDNSGAIVVSGGSVALKAAVLKNALRNVINMSGSINADSATGNGGTITLLGGADTADMAGTLSVSGSLSARATGASGNGGSIETSGEHVNLTGSSVTTASAHGKAGTWTIDPVDFTVAASGGDETGAALTTALAGGNVVILSSRGASGANGDININDTVSWSANTLTLDAYRNININAVMNATGTAGFVGITGDTGGNGASTGGALLMGLGSGGFYGTLNLAATGSFTLNGTGYTIIDSLGSAGSTTGADLQGINGNLNGNYVLGANIDASATSGWNSGAGFTSLGTDGAGTTLNNYSGYNGQFNGLGHTVSGLTINQTVGNETGLFGRLGNSGSVSNIGLAGGAISGVSWVGALVAYNNGTISNDYATASVTDTGGLIGGLVGLNYATISNSWASGNVSGGSSGSTVGGLVGLHVDGAITNSYATGNVTGVDEVGGLTGMSNVYATISNVYATGNVTGHYYVGGLDGFNTYYTSISNAYATGSVTGNSYVGGLVGGDYGATVANSYASGHVSGTGSDIGGLIGEIAQTCGSGCVPGQISNSYWDSYSTGQTNGYGRLASDGSTATNLIAVTSAPTQSAATNYAFSAGAYANLGSGFALINGLRPVLVAQEATAEGGTAFITNAIQLQAINASAATLAGNYVLANNIDLSATGAIAACTAAANCTPASYSGMWAGTGFVPLGTNGNSLVWNGSSFASINHFGGNGTSSGYTGLFDGAGYAVTNLTVNRPGTSFAGLFGYLGGGTIQNLTVSGSVTAQDNAGVLAGDAFGTVTNDASSGRVSGTSWLGGLLGMVAGNSVTSGSSSSATVTCVGASQCGALGGLVGASRGNPTITSSFATGNVDGTDNTPGGNFDLGGLVGDGGNVTISNSHATGNVTGGTEAFIMGGLVGISNSAVSNSWASGTVTGGSDSWALGGLIGSANSTLSQSYATGSVSGGSEGNVGGLAGSNNGTITSSYATGSVNGTANNVGGLVGYNNGAISNAYATGSVSGTANNVGGLVGYNGSTIGTSYATGSVHGVGSGVGGLTGYNDGIITSSYATGNVSGVSYVGGLVGYSDTGDSEDGGTISNSYATGNVTSSGGSLVGGLAGFNVGSITGSYATGNVSGASGDNSGGLVGYNNGAISNAYATGSVSSSGNYVGGLVGGNDSSGTISHAYATGSVTSTADYVGGLAGANNNTITATYATGSVSAEGSHLGGLVGLNNATLSNSYWDSYGTGLPGATGQNAGTLTNVGMVTSDPSQSGAANYAYNPAAWAYFTTSSAASDIDTTGGQTLTWRMYAGNTAPLLKAFMTAVNIGSTLSSPVSVIYNGQNQSATLGGGYSATLASSAAPANASLIKGTATTACTGGDASCTNAGNYSVAVTGGLYSTQQGYDLIYTTPSSPNLTITPAALTITYTANAATSTYGQTPTGLTGVVSSSGLVTGDSLMGTASWATPATSATGVGSYAINGSGLGASANYTVTSVQATGNASALTITPAALTITGNTTSGVYNGAARTNGFTTSALYNGDSVTGVAGLASGRNAGRYSDNLANATGTGLGNYTISYVNGGLTITPAALTITYSSNTATSTYGQTPTGLTGTVSSSGLITGDSLTGTASWTTPATGATGIGRYAINGSGVSASTNYTVSYVQAAGNASVLTITPAALTITYTSNAATSTYGQAPTGLTGKVSSSGLIAGDSLTGTASWTTSATSATGVGSYAINGSGVSAGANYAVTSTQAAGNASALTITPAALTITYTATPATILFGQPLPAFTGTLGASGLVNGDTLAGATTGTVVWTTPATATSFAGAYAINGSGLTGKTGNYTITNVQAAGNALALTINPSGQALTSFVPFAGGASPQAGANGASTDCAPSSIVRAYRETGRASLTDAGGSCGR